MQYYINEWSEQTVSLIAEDGYSLNTFENLADAIDACFYHCMVESEYIERYDNYPGVSDLDFESDFMSLLKKNLAKIKKARINSI